MASGGFEIIARVWHGMTPASKGDAYYEYLKESGLKKYRSIAGNRGVCVLRRIEGGHAHFLLISLWDSFDAIRNFAGPDFENAVYYPRDKDFLRKFEPNVTHYDVLEGPPAE